ncbi:MAG: GNAT family N-acetyltransferase [Streptomyces sp.]
MSRPARPPGIRFEFIAETVPAGDRAIVMLDPAHREVGRLDYRVCHPCRLGYIGNICVATQWQGQGLARHAVHTALEACTGYAWATSRQSAEGRRFFSAMAEETEVTFPPTGVRCPHMGP